MDQETILIADDHPVFRVGLCNLIATALPKARLIEAHSTDEVIDSIKQFGQPSLLVLDYVFPGLDPNSTLGTLRQLAPRTSIIVISMLEDEKIVELIIDQGADSFISKSIPADEMLAALMAVRAGEFVVKRGECAQPSGNFRVLPLNTEFSARQNQIMDLLRQGKTNKQIARELDLSPFTVRNHLSRIMQALGVSKRSEILSIVGDAGRAAPSA